ncbi:MAG: Peptidase M15A [Candidatus Collierbacteria bacterium GW2011_GWB1_45_35]|uniref:Peptidase M15A n=1 Tax=Candidatus Collierbacteria bacterium GW2011_GWB2_45_17 TaxID=1618388 RepID=A0A837IIX2_9BACT|nr:MAG: Peptidase M15A [Microgenomates group bacterium GW2011_GWC1_44_23]KKT96273.1 MAG: Peptidase M15A [Candidatus Collierbacteria bacterium GW2011_GWA1_45_15]KKU01313.1 MAG: Peptidase M15A [Candidatus Collierbacteria bacterium GW2011_GWB2_45_17]KKU05015.1 MAG: Peptidase M15A [Candidatus Collierbacteria bacterium GW2011_GWB1_45_35]HCX25772.1 hypothetical protein [Candidatus Collierbacteria bacterium]
MTELGKQFPYDALKASGETAVHRYGPSFSARILVERDLLEGNIFDWGCGRGYDLNYFRSKGFSAEGWDPVHLPENPPEKYSAGSFDLVHCAFVLNTLPDSEERLKILRAIHDFLPASGEISLTVRSQSNIKTNLKPTWKRFGDGWLTPKGTFQRGYTAEELVEIITPLFKDIIVFSRDPVFIIASPV